MMGSPLGKYSDLGASIVSILVIGAWIAVHVLIVVVQSLGGTVPPGVDTAELDLGGTLALGVILGQRATTNGASHIANLANARLDAIGAPSAAAAVAAQAAGDAPRSPVNPADNTPARGPLDG